MRDTDVPPNAVAERIATLSKEQKMWLGKEKYKKLAETETEMEYEWKVSLSGRDQVLLLEGEAQGCWGPGVFSITISDPAEPWSLTQHASYWTGDSLEKGDPVNTETPL